MRNLTNLELIVNHDYPVMEVSIYGRINEGSRIFIIGYDGDHIVEQEVIPGDEFVSSTTFKPLLRANVFIFESIMKAFIEYGSKKEIKTVNENLLQGKMQAVTDHLTDMREMNKKMLDTILIKMK